LNDPTFMRWRPLIWALVSLLCFLGAICFWQWGERIEDEKRATSALETEFPAARQSTVVPATAAPVTPAVETDEPAETDSPKDLRIQYRVSNTTLTAGQLSRRDSGILLANALIDTSLPLNLGIPESLKATNDPGAYIVQARGLMTDYFRAQLRGAGAEWVAYIPNNAALVRASADTARQLSAMPSVRAVLPFEPYYKLDWRLLAMVREDRPLPEDAFLSVVLFESSRAETEQQLADNGFQVLREDRSPFGPVLFVKPPRNGLTALAGLGGVQNVGLASPRKPANDLSRAKIGVAVDSIVETNYLNLTGQNVIVSLNDTGVDAGHPALAGRVFGDFTASLQDTNGHGTHMAGIIGGNGAESMTVTNASGSIMPGTNTQFRGMAHLSRIYSQLVFPFSHSNAIVELTDFEIQRNAALTNAWISVNGWNYDNSDYDIAAASFDAAVRDSLPDMTGSQPLAYVFPAGNSGNGTTDGVGRTEGTILSPATAKNVITVGAVEQLRGITNEVERIQPGGGTNITAEWLSWTDTDNQVAHFSSRGNVGVQVEGDFGRFKPDVVAPGVFVVSTTRKDQWDQAAYYNPTNVHRNTRIEVVLGERLQNFPLLLPFNTVGPVTIRAEAIHPDVDLPILYRRTSFPTLTQFGAVGTNELTIQPGGGNDQYGPLPAIHFYGIYNPTNLAVRYQVTTIFATTNDNGNYFEVLKDMNDSLGPFYRYETGTSMSAADVAGMLALISDYFTNQLQRRPSPALLKALLINGARTVNADYNLEVRKELNDQGWGLPSLTNSLPAGWAGTIGAPAGAAPMLVFEQSPTNAVATGEQRTFNIRLNGDATNQPLRVTLVWTDPPGNPVAGIKLVNDLDLVVTNLTTGEIYLGNDFPPGSSFTFAWDTNTPPDNVNNVENVYISSAVVGTEYSISVIGRAVNVNAVPDHPDNVVQDFALVVSSGDGTVDDAISMTTSLTELALNRPNVTAMTNQFAEVTNNITGGLLLNQHVGANSPLIGGQRIPLGSNTLWGTAGTNGVIELGVTNQWHFYVLSNTMAFTNAAFVTFLPPTLSLPRMGVTNYDLSEEASRLEADIDMYVSTDARLLDLDPAVLEAADKSLGRLGTEMVTYTNAQPGAYYIGIHSQDQQAAEYAFFGVFSELPFSTTDSNGVQHVRGINVPAVIPEGPPDQPGGAMVMAIALQPTTVRRVVVTNTITHENILNLFGALTHNQQTVVLNNHSCVEDPDNPGQCVTNWTYIYEDNGEGDIPNEPPFQRTDGPGSLTGFIGERAEGLWMLTMVDNSIGSTGRVDSVWLRIEPEVFGDGVLLDVPPNSFAYTSADVPPEGANMTICVENESDIPLPLQLYVRRGELPTLTEYDHTLPIPIRGACLTIDRSSFPPLQAGRYFIGVYNPNETSQRVRIWIRIETDPQGVTPLIHRTILPTPILDDAVSYSSIQVTNRERIIRAEVGVAIAHPRVSDLAITLISPSGKRILLFENRGGPDWADLGHVTLNTNLADFLWIGNGTDTIDVPAGANTGVLLIDYDHGGDPDTIDVFYEGENIFSAGPVAGAGQFLVNYGPGAATDLQVVMNQGGDAVPESAWTNRFTALTVDASYFVFTENTNSAGLPIKFGMNSVIPGTNSLTSDFESTAPGDYLSTGVIPGAGWDVLSNRVSVVNDPVTADAGNQFLALADGTIFRDLEVTPGRRYRVSFNYRGPDIVSWWRGEQTPFDNVGGNSGSMVGGVAFSDGVVGQGFQFNGSSYVRVPHNASLNLSNGLTWEMWFRNDVGPSAVMGLIGKRPFAGEPCNYGINLLQSPPGLGAYYGDPFASYPASGSDPGEGVFETVRHPTIPESGRFHHIAAVYQQVGPSNVRVGVHLNGQLVRSLVMQGNLANTFNTVDLLIGSTHPDGEEFMNGILDEVSLYRRALSGAEIHAIYSRTNAGKFDPAAPAPLNLAKAEVSLGADSQVIYGDNGQWSTFQAVFFPTSSPMPLRITGLAPGMLLDSFSLDQLPTEDFVLPEESLRAVVGDSAFGEWRLEVWDRRAGATNPVPQITSWELRFILETNLDVVELHDGVAVTNTLAPCQVAKYFVDVPLWAEQAVNRLLFATPPGVNVWFNQDAPEVNGASLLIQPAPSLGGEATLTTTDDPQLIPGSRYYLLVENPCSSPTNVTYALEVNFIRGIITLTNMIPYANTNSGSDGGSSDFYRFVVSPTAARAQFEINFPTGDMTLVARAGAPPPSLSVFDYISANPALNDELIVVVTNSTPVALTAGEWYLTAVNISGGEVAYSIKASEWPVTGRPFSVTNVVTTSNSLCLTWEALPGVHYYIQGIEELTLSNWHTVSPTITAGPMDESLTYCISLPSPYRFFRVAEGLALTGVPEPSPDLTVTAVTNGYLLEWTGGITAMYQPQWTASLTPPPPLWNSFTNVITSTNGYFWFLDDSTQSGSLGGTRFYRVRQWLPE